MKTHRRLKNEDGIAMAVAMMIALAVAAISLGAATLAMNISLINRYSERSSLLESVAAAGIEEARSRINGDASLYPDTLYNAIENGVSVTDAYGASIADVSRSTYVGPTGITSGQYGVFGSIVVVAEDNFGNRVVRRAEVSQESFAKYAYFTNSEGGNIWFGGGDQIFGPLHTNDQIKIHYTGATFHGPVETASDVYQASNGTFVQGYLEGAAKIPMPKTADLLKLRTQAQAGNTSFTGNVSGGHGEVTTRIEFVALDLNADGDSTDANEGFMRVYQALSDAEWVSGDVPSNYRSRGLRNSRNCGHYHPNGEFIVADDHPARGNDSWVASVSNVRRRCFLGGSDSLFNGFQANDGTGGWLRWPGTVSTLLAGRPDAQYLFPITRPLNPSFKGVVYVQGKVGVSGVLRGRVTVAATDDIVFLDDVKYATDPGAGTCTDILGVFSGDDVVVADNTLNAPIRPKRNGSGNNYRTYDDTKDEFFHAVVLALNIFTVENYNSGATRTERCEGNRVGRGCMYLTGGVIQATRGAVGTTAGTGYVKRYSYDMCAASAPPPYFPTTGHFGRSRSFEVDPTGFDIDQYFRLLTPR